MLILVGFILTELVKQKGPVHAVLQIIFNPGWIKFHRFTQKWKTWFQPSDFYPSVKHKCLQCFRPKNKTQLWAQCGLEKDAKSHNSIIHTLESHWLLTQLDLTPHTSDNNVDRSSLRGLSRRVRSAPFSHMYSREDDITASRGYCQAKKMPQPPHQVPAGHMS